MRRSKEFFEISSNFGPAFVTFVAANELADFRRFIGAAPAPNQFPTTETIMFKATIISTIFAAGAFQVSADPSNGYDLSILPVDVAARVMELQKHGDRFEATIRAIFAEAMKPDWTFEDSGQEPADITVAAQKD